MFICSYSIYNNFEGTMPNKKIVSNAEEVRLPGRPLENPLYKTSVSRRFLVSPETALVIDQSMNTHGFGDDISNYLRWLVWKQLKEDGLVDQINTSDDNTWKDLIKNGLIE
jgi:hypothetical protein